MCTCYAQVAYTDWSKACIKSGHLLRYKQRLLKPNWRRDFVLLLADSSLIFFKGEGEAREAQGRIVLSDAPQLIASGSYTDMVSVAHRPKTLPAGYSVDQLLVVGDAKRLSQRKELTVSVHWFLTDHPQSTTEWLSAISSTIKTRRVRWASEADVDRKKQNDIGKGSGFLATRKTLDQGDPTQVLCYFAASDMALDFSQPDLGFDLADFDCSMGDFGDGAMGDFGGSFF